MSDHSTEIPNDGFMALIGATITEAEPTRCVVTLELDARHHQPYGITHGGIYCTLAEGAASIGAVVAQGGKPAVGMSNHTDFLKATRSGTLTAVATPIHQGRSSQLWEVRITNDDEGVDGVLVAQSKVRVFNLADRPAK